MTFSDIAKRLGRRGGLQRAKRLSRQRRAEIAKLGARARIESLNLARRIQDNFDYVAAILELHPRKPVRPQSSFTGRLPSADERNG